MLLCWSIKQNHEHLLCTTTYLHSLQYSACSTQSGTDESAKIFLLSWSVGRQTRPGHAVPSIDAPACVVCSWQLAVSRARQKNLHNLTTACFIIIIIIENISTAQCSSCTLCRGTTEQASSQVIHGSSTVCGEWLCSVHWSVQHNA